MPNILGITQNYPLQPKINNLFTLFLDYVPGTGGGADTDTQPIYKMRLDLQSAKRPLFQVTPISIARINMKYKVASTPNFEDTLEIVFKDTIQNDMARIMYRWYKMIFNPITGSMGYASSYKTDGHIDVLDPLGALVERWHFKGIFPSTITNGELSYESPAAMTVSCTFQYDVAYLDETVPAALSFPTEKARVNDAGKTNAWTTAQGDNVTTGYGPTALSDVTQVTPIPKTE